MYRVSPSHEVCACICSPCRAVAGREDTKPGTRVVSVPVEGNRKTSGWASGGSRNETPWTACLKTTDVLSRRPEVQNQGPCLLPSSLEEDPSFLLPASRKARSSSAYGNTTPVSASSSCGLLSVSLPKFSSSYRDTVSHVELGPTPTTTS